MPLKSMNELFWVFFLSTKGEINTLTLYLYNLYLNSYFVEIKNKFDILFREKGPIKTILKPLKVTINTPSPPKKYFKQQSVSHFSFLAELGDNFKYK